MSQHVRADRVALVTSNQQMDQVLYLRNVLGLIHIEVVEPEIHHYFFQLPVGIYRAENLASLRSLADDLPGRLPELSLPA